MNIKSYKTADGKTRYKFNIYLGINPLTGKEIRTNRQGFKTKQEARLEYFRLASGAETPAKPKKTFESLYLEWLETYKNTVKPSTLVQTNNLFENHILPAFGTADIDKLTIAHIQDFANTKAPKYSKTRAMLGYTSQVFERAMSQELITKNPCDFVTFPNKLEKKGTSKENYWDTEELKKFLEVIKEEPLKIHLLLRYIAMTGVRRGECLANLWTDKNGLEIKIDKTRSRGPKGEETFPTPKTEKANRMISIDDYTSELFDEWRLMQTKMFGFKEIIFTNNSGTYLGLNKPLTYLKRVIKKHKLKSITIHGLRHTHTTMLVKAGVPIEEIMDRIGHEDIQTTIGIYNHITKTQKNKTMDKLIEHLS